MQGSNEPQEKCDLECFLIGVLHKEKGPVEGASLRPKLTRGNSKSERKRSKLLYLLGFRIWGSG